MRSWRGASGAPRRDPPGAASRLAAMPSFRAAYLIHGDDHGRIAERRARLRAMAEQAAGSAGVEVYEGDACTPENVAAALSTMTFALGRRFVIADGVERWKESDVDAVARALQGADDAHRRVLRPRGGQEQGAGEAARGGRRRRRPDRRRERAQGPRAAEVARRAGAGARRDDRPAGREGADRPGRRPPPAPAARAGEARARARRGRARSTADEVHEACASSAERKVWTLADALVAGDSRTATRLLLELRQQGERTARPRLQHGPPAARRAADRRGAGAGPVARPGPQDAADALVRRRPAHRRRLQARRRGAAQARSRRWPTSRWRAAAAPAARSARRRSRCEPC